MGITEYGADKPAELTCRVDFVTRIVRRLLDKLRRLRRSCEIFMPGWRVPFTRTWEIVHHSKDNMSQNHDA